MDRTRYAFTDDEMDKLPKWAQNRIHSMAHRISDLEGFLTKQEPTKTEFGYGMTGDEHGYLPDRAPRPPAAGQGQTAD